MYFPSFNYSEPGSSGSDVPHKILDAPIHMGALTQEDDVHQMKQGSIWIAKRDDTLVRFIAFDDPFMPRTFYMQFLFCGLISLSTAMVMLRQSVYLTTLTHGIHVY